MSAPAARAQPDAEQGGSAYFVMNMKREDERLDVRYGQNGCRHVGKPLNNEQVQSRRDGRDLGRRANTGTRRLGQDAQSRACVRWRTPRLVRANEWLKQTHAIGRKDRRETRGSSQ